MTDDLAVENYPDRIKAVYVGKTVVVTGGTGFIGKVLLEKLLRCCSGIERIYMLIRPKKGKTAQDRLKEIFDGPVFDKLRAENKAHGALFAKVLPVHAVMSAPDLGLSAQDRAAIVEHANIVYHCAACVRFDTPLKQAVLLNVRGTKLMLELAVECRQLNLFVHLSTAYCQVHEKVLREKTYDPPYNPHHMIQICEWMADDVVDAMTEKFLGNMPNTYAYTKALSEGLVNEHIDTLPIQILRPSIVVPVWREPLPGWTDNLNGPTGLLIGAGKGVIRTMYCKSGSCGDFLPADILVNAILAATQDFIVNKGVRRIMNVTSSDELRVSFEELINVGRKVIETEVPLNWVMWYPGGSIKHSRLMHTICFYLFQMLPAIVIDSILMLLGIKPILLRVQKRISKGFETFDYYINRDWEFDNTLGREARALLNPRESAEYKLNAEGINYHAYFADCTRAARRYLLKETDDTLPTAKRHMMVMWYVDKICKTLIIFAFFYYLWTKVVSPILRI